MPVVGRRGVRAELPEREVGTLRRTGGRAACERDGWRRMSKEHDHLARGCALYHLSQIEVPGKGLGYVVQLHSDNCDGDHTIYCEYPGLSTSEQR